MKHRHRRVPKFEALEGGLVYTVWNMTCCPMTNSKYPTPERSVGRREETGGARVSRIEKSKNNWFVVFTVLYYTRNICLVKNGVSTESFSKGYLENTPSKNTWLRNNLTVFPLWLLLSVRLGVYIVNWCSFYSYRIIGKLTDFFHLQEFIFLNLTVTSSTTTTWPSPHSSSLRSTTFSSRLHHCG